MKINSKSELKSVLDYEKKALLNKNEISCELRYRNSLKYNFYRYVKALRIYEYLCCARDNSKSAFAKLFYSFRVKAADRKKNKLCMLTGVEITPFMVEKGVNIWHQNVVINGYVGENCIFHGNNIIGNKVSGSTEVPHIGNNVDVGVGAIIIGNVKIADGCVIGAGAVVTKSFEEPGMVIAGVPAKKICV